ncbi:uncharacterized protein FIESC28_04728 [Fusarium coffeatum]|uniref:2EXR domain-containing protein n=1 Tax=Fusarium coffeatum TaxID=231269 RepID=A0A366RZV0_9HYPO|nr:uncharacterized protein FIESC28_04728 [Fusarium coffeatum]RBR21885.1 hypothetical protein FIESC28_04728 [Fusarium coffeatum]
MVSIITTETTIPQSTCSYDHDKPTEFAHLPPELRRMIWRSSLAGPRIHKAVPKIVCVRPMYHGTQIISPQPPVALSVCKESRDVACKVLTPFLRCQCLACRLDPSPFQCQEHGKIGYFNRQLDILHLDPWNLFEDRDVRWVDFTQISVPDCYDENWVYERLSRILESRPRISQIYLTILRTDERMKEKAERKRNLRHHMSHGYELVKKAACVALEELEVVKNKDELSEALGERKQFDECEEMAEVLLKKFGMDRDIVVDVAFAKVCCSCP